MVNVASILLGLACGFGAGVWFIVAVYNWRLHHRWHAFWSVVLGVAYWVTTVILIGRLLGYFLELPRGFSIILLAPILAVPPAIQLFGWLKARRLIAAQRVAR